MKNRKGLNMSKDEKNFIASCPSTGERIGTNDLILIYRRTTKFNPRHTVIERCAASKST